MDKVIVTRKIYVCKNCDGVYADSPVTECDCQVGVKPKWYITKIAYNKGVKHGKAR